MTVVDRGEGGESLGALDLLAADLQELRREAGAPSYAEIAARIARRREAEGMPPAAAQVARSSVYDVFRTGRRRVNADLVAEIALALGAGAEEAQEWRARCLQARIPAIPAAPPAPAPAAPVSSPVPDARDLPASRGDLSIAARLAPTPEFAAVLMFAAVCVNLVGGTIASRFGLILYLDMIGTAAVALLLGPWRAAAVGALTNIVASFMWMPETIVFGVVNALGGLVWGYGIRYWRADRSLGRFLSLTALVAVACTVVGVPLNVVMYHGQRLHSNYGMQIFADEVWRAVAAINLSVSLLDKLVAGILAYGAVQLILWLRRSEPFRATRLRP